MKKYLIPIILASVIAFSFGKMIIDNYQGTKPVFNEAEKVYILQQGVYSSIDSMKENTKKISHYIYIVDKNLYRVYVGITKKKENAEKLEAMYKKMGNNIYIREVDINNKKFLDKLNGYDETLKNAKEYIAMINIMQEVLADYEKLVVKGASGS